MLMRAKKISLTKCCKAIQSSSHKLCGYAEKRQIIAVQENSKSVTPMDTLS